MAKVVGEIDTRVRVPAAVAAQAARAEELHKLATTPPADEIVTPPAEAKTNGHDAPVDPPPVETPAPSPAPAPVPIEEEDSWENRYKSMKGRYDKEVPRMREQISTFSTEVANLRSMLATLETRVPETKPAEPKQATKLVTAEEEAEYGTDFLSVVARKAREEFEPIADAYKAEIEALRGELKNVGGYVQQTAQQRMEALLDEKLPDWREINAGWESNGFKDWLQLPDLYSGAIRHQLLNAAYERNDTPRVLAFFKGFLAEEAATAPVKSEPDLSAIGAKVPLKDLAAPGRARSAAPETPAEKPLITRAQAQKFWNDCARGAYRGREQEKDRLETEIFAAMNEGRLIN